MKESKTFRVKGRISGWFCCRGGEIVSCSSNLHKFLHSPPGVLVSWVESKLCSVEKFDVSISW